MPQPNKRDNKVQNALSKRWSNAEFSSSSELSYEEYKMDTDDEAVAFSEKILLNDIGDLAEICTSKCDTNYLTTLLYVSLRYFNIKWEDINRFLEDVSFMAAETSHRWATVFSKGDYEEFSNDLRGDKQTDWFHRLK